MREIEATEIELVYGGVQRVVIKPEQPSNPFVSTGSTSGRGPDIGNIPVTGGGGMGGSGGIGGDRPPAFDGE